MDCLVLGKHNLGDREDGGWRFQLCGSEEEHQEQEGEAQGRAAASFTIQPSFSSSC